MTRTVIAGKKWKEGLSQIWLTTQSNMELKHNRDAMHYLCAQRLQSKYCSVNKASVCTSHYIIKSLIILSVTDPDISLWQIPDVNFTSHQSCYWEWGSVATAVGSKVNLVARTTSFRCVSGGSYQSLSKLLHLTPDHGLVMFPFSHPSPSLRFYK